MCIGVGGSPEGVATACAIKALGGHIQGRLWPRDDDEKQRGIDAGLRLDDYVYEADELVTGKNTIFVATGVTNGELVAGVRRDGDFVYTESVNFPFLGGAAVLLALYWFLTHKFMGWFMSRHWAAWVILLPIGVVTWWLVYESGIHATIAGVLLGFMVPVLKQKPRIIRQEDPRMGLAPALEHRFRPLSNGFVIPVFAFFSAGVAVGGWDGVTSAATDPVALGIVAGLLLGKPIGIFGAAWLMDRFTSAEKDRDYTWFDMFGMTIVAGIGFTVSLLVGELSFGEGSPHGDHAKVGILCGSLLAALIDQWCEEQRRLAFAWRECQLIAAREDRYGPVAQRWTTMWRNFWEEVCARCGHPARGGAAGGSGGVDRGARRRRVRRGPGPWRCGVV